MAIAKVIVNGSTIVDMTDATATASEVLTGYTAYGKDGSKITGEATGGGGLVDVTTTLQNGGTYHAISGVDLSSDTVDARHLATGYTAHDSTGTAIVGTMSGGSATLITKSITANGTYNASSDSADGYSSVTVNVSGGSTLELVAITMTKTSLGGQHAHALYSTTNDKSNLKCQYPPSTTTVYIPKYSSTQGLLALSSTGGTYAPYISGMTGTYTTLNSSNSYATYRVDIGGTFTVGASDIS